MSNSYFENSGLGNADDFFEKFNSQVTFGTKKLTEFCEETEITDKTLTHYLQDTVSNKSRGSYNGYVQFTENAQKANLTFGQSLLGIGKALGKNLLIFAAVTAVTWAISSLIKKAVEWSNRAQIAKENTIRLAEEYENLSSQVKETEEKLADLNKQISELDPIVDSEEIANLKLETTELEAQLAILKEKERLKKEEANESARESLNTTVVSKYATKEVTRRVHADGNEGTFTATEPVEVTRYQELELANQEYNKVKQEQLELEKELLEMTDKSSEEYLQKSNEIISKGEKLNEINEYRNSLATELSAELPALTGTSTKDIELRNSIQSSLDSYVNSISTDEAAKDLREKLRVIYGDAVNSLTNSDLSIIASVDIDITQTKENLEQQLTELQKGGGVNLKLRPQIDASVLNEAGWDAGEGIATVFSSTYSNEDGTKAINFTPIVVDPKTGKFLRVLTPDALNEYAAEVISGTRTDDLNLQIGSEFTGDNAIEQAAATAAKISRLSGDYYLFDGDHIIDIDSLKDEIKLARMKMFAETHKDSTITESVKDIADQLEPQFSALKEAYQDIFTDEGFTLKNIDNAMLENLRSTFSEIDESLGINFDTNQLEEFFSVLSSGSSTGEQVQNAFDGIATAYLNSTYVLDNLNSSTRESIINGLEQLGVKNAETLVDERLAIQEKFLEFQKRGLIDATKKLSEVTAEDIIQLQSEGLAADETTMYLSYLLASKIDLNNIELNTNDDINNLIAIANAAGMATWKLKELQKAKAAFDSLATLNSNEIRNKYADEAEYLEAVHQAEMYMDRIQNDAESYYSGIDPSEFYAKAGGSKVDYKPNKGTSSGSSGSGSETEEVIDHIATKIERLEREIENLGKTANATYKTWSERNDALSKQISKTTEEIALQEEALAYYQKKANAVGLSKEYQDLVKYGGIRIDTIKDEKLAEKISDYQEWYDKILACEDAVEDLNAELANLAKQKFDNISSEFDNKFSSIEHEMNVLEALIDQTETRGHIVSTKYYESLIESEKKNIELLEQEYKALANELSNAMATGDIKEGSEDWYTMKESINEVKLEIIEANTELIEFENSIRDVEWENFDRLQEKIAAITDEAEFLISLMENSELYDDNGQLTDTGMGTLGLRVQNYNVLMNQADKYAAEVEKINAELANDPNNQELLDRKQELIELQRESILAANDECDAIKSLVKEGIQIELNSLKELIDEYNEALDSAKD